MLLEARPQPASLLLREGSSFHHELAGGTCAELCTLKEYGGYYYYYFLYFHLFLVS